MKRRAITLALLNAAAFAAMVIVNGLANGLPLNGRGTGEISDLYPNLFVPAGITFAIWAVIYILLAGFCAYGLVVAVKSRGDASGASRIGPFFVISSLANMGWIFAWHWQAIGLSVALMLVLLIALVLAYLRLEIGKGKVGLLERLFFQVPFSVYLGWITVATIANITALLVAINWNGFGIPAVAWTVGMILAAIIIAAAVIVTRDDLPYALVIVWALVGIYMKRSANLDEPAPAVAMTALVGAVGLVIAALSSRVIRRRRAARTSSTEGAPRREPDGT